MGILDEFRGEKIPAAFNKDTQPGYYVRGPIVDVAAADRTDYKTGEKLFFKDGKPRRQIVVTIQTSIRDPQIPKDDGRRRIYVKMDYKSDREALLDAVKAAGDDDVQIGGELAAQFLGRLPGEDGQLQEWNSFKYEYKRPSALASAAGIPAGIPAPVPPALTKPAPIPPAQPAMFPPPAAPAAPAQDPAAIAAALLAAQQQAAPPAPAPAAPAVDAATSAAIRSLITAGLDDDTIAGAYPAVPRALIVALRNAAAMAGA